MLRRFWPVLITVLLFAQTGWAQQQSESIGYDSIEEAFAALDQDPSANRSSYEGWILFNRKDNGIYTIWSFTTELHPTHPSVVRRDIVKKGSEIYIKMNSICHSSQFVCDQLIDAFEQINARIKQKHGGAASQ